MGEQGDSAPGRGFLGERRHPGLEQHRGCSATAPPWCQPDAAMRKNKVKKCDFKHQSPSFLHPAEVKGKVPEGWV